MKLLPPHLRAALVGLGVLAGLCGAERLALAQRVYGPTGRPYGPTQSQYQYQRQYGRVGSGLNGYGAAVANGPGSTHQWLSPGFTGGAAYRGGAYGGYHYHGNRSGWPAGGYGYGYGVPFGYGYGSGYGFNPGYGWGYGGYGLDYGLYASPYGYGGVGFGAVAYPAVVAATPAPIFLNGPGVNLTGGGVGFAASDGPALHALNANSDAAALAALGNNAVGNGFGNGIGNATDLPLPPADPATRPLKFSTADQKLRSLQAQSSGDRHMQRQAWQRAYADYKRAVELADDSGSAHFRLGCVLTTLKYYGSAVKSYRRALHADPLLPNQRQLLDRIYGEDSMAVRKQLVSRLIEYTNAGLGDPDRLFLLGVYLHYQNDPRSIELFEAAASQLPVTPAHIQAFLNADGPAVGAEAAPAPLDDAIPPLPGGPAEVPPPPQPLFKATPTLVPRKPEAPPARPAPIQLPPIQPTPEAVVPPAAAAADAAGELPPAPVPDEQLPPVTTDDPVRRDADLPLMPPQ